MKPVPARAHSSDAPEAGAADDALVDEAGSAQGAGASPVAVDMTPGASAAAAVPSASGVASAGGSSGGSDGEEGQPGAPTTASVPTPSAAAPPPVPAVSPDAKDEGSGPDPSTATQRPGSRPHLTVNVELAAVTGAVRPLSTGGNGRIALGESSVTPLPPAQGVPGASDDGAGVGRHGSDATPVVQHRLSQQEIVSRKVSRTQRSGTDWLGDQGLEGIDFVEEADQGTGLVPEELEPDDYGDGDVVGTIVVGRVVVLLYGSLDMCNCQVMYNYGSPRVGNYPFALMYDVQVPHSFRVVFDGDPITAVPKFVRLYKHVGQEVRACVVGRPTCSSSHSRLTCADSSGGTGQAGQHHR